MPFYNVSLVILNQYDSLNHLNYTKPYANVQKYNVQIGNHVGFLLKVHMPVAGRGGSAWHGGVGGGGTLAEVHQVQPTPGAAAPATLDQET